MKNATKYEKKVKKLLGSLGKPPAPPAPADPVRALIESVLLADATRKQAQDAMKAMETEFVDFNELRVSPTKEIVECLGKDYPFARQRAEALAKVLNAVVAKTGTMTMTYMEKMPKRDLRRHLLEIGLSAFSAAYVVATVFGGHAIAVDQSLVDVLEAQEQIHPGSDIEDVQGFLERIVPQKDGPAINEALRRYLEKFTKMLTQKRQVRETAAAIVAKAQEVKDDAAAKARSEAQQAARLAQAAAQAAAKAAARQRGRPTRPKASVAKKVGKGKK